MCERVCVLVCLWVGGQMNGVVNQAAIDTPEAGSEYLDVERQG